MEKLLPLAVLESTVGPPFPDSTVFSYTADMPEKADLTLRIAASNDCYRRMMDFFAPDPRGREWSISR